MCVLFKNAYFHFSLFLNKWGKSGEFSIDKKKL